MKLDMQSAKSLFFFFFFSFSVDHMFIARDGPVAVDLRRALTPVEETLYGDPVPSPIV